MTPTQRKLLNLIDDHRGENKPFKYDTMKNLCIEEVKTFEMTFNALLFKGYFNHFATNDFTNQFIRVKKK